MSLWNARRSPLLATMGFNLAWGVSSWVSGTWQTQNQLPLVFAVSAGFFLLSTAVLQWTFRRTGDKQAPEPVTRTVVGRVEEPVT